MLIITSLAGRRPSNQLSMLHGANNFFCSPFVLSALLLLLITFQTNVPVCQAWKFHWRRKQQGMTTDDSSSSSPPSPGIDLDNPTSFTGGPGGPPSPWIAFHMPPPDSPIYRNLQSISSFFQKMMDKSLDIILYKPPVGAVALVLGLRLVWTGRIFQLERPETDVKEQIFKQQARSTSFVGKALDLDTDDANYRRLGGIDATRKRLCEAAWASPEETAKGPMEQALLKALQVTHKPSGTRADFLQRLIVPLAEVESLLVRSKDARALASSEDNRVLIISELTLQIQAMDALLRLCRNRLLQTVYRLARAKEYWDRRINESRWWQVGNNDVENRIRLAQAQAAYQAEVKRLGRIMEALLQRPNDLEEGLLLQALKATEQERLVAQNSDGGENENKDNNPLSSLMPPWIDKQRMRRWHPREWKFPKLYSLHWRGGRWYVQKNERAANDVSPSCARQALTEGTSDEWMTQAREWTLRSRQLVDEIVRECLEGCSSQDLYTVEAWDRLVWASQHYGEGDTQKDWSTVLHYVNALSTWRRIGESKVVRLKDAAIVHWSKRLDIMGIPSYLASIWIANRFHNWIVPRWPQLKRDGIEIFETVVSIWIARVWVPFKGIVDELMNRSKGIMSALSVEDEQTSLDHMLRDMGFGDGTSESRRIALQRASEQYEQDLRSGVFVNLARGRLVRLLLVQVQQLKVGLLSALGTIDVLMKGNQIHFQLLAAVPAVLIATFGTRLFLRALYNIRSRDIRPVKVVHGEMAIYLDKIERLLRLAEREHNDQLLTGKRVQLSWADFGELILLMYRYLMLLDYGSPPFPSRQCDQIRLLLHDIVQNIDGKVDATWMIAVKQKHQELFKYL